MSIRTKRCFRCGENKTEKGFYANRAKFDGLTEDCIECRRAVQARRRAAKPEACNEATRRWRAKQPIKPPHKTVQKGTPEWNARQKRITGLWNAKNPAKLLVNVRKRQAMQRGAVCDCCQTEDAKANFVLTYALARRLKMHVDHVRPLAKGGKHCLLNLQLLTPTDNRRKGAKWIPTSEAA